MATNHGLVALAAGPGMGEGNYYIYEFASTPEVIPALKLICSSSVADLVSQLIKLQNSCVSSYFLVWAHL